MAKQVKVAIIGASGIGKQHAKWFHLSGCDVAAFAGRTPESVEKTTQVLKGLFEFKGKGYWDCDEMLRAEEPDAVVVSSPASLHREHAVRALAAGAHVLCEKPLVWRADRDARSILEDGRAIVDAATAHGRILAINTQYAAGIGAYEQVVPKCARGRCAVDSFYMEMETKGGGGMHEYEQIFIDNASHPISLALAWLPGAKADEGTLSCQVGRKETVAAFHLIRADGGICQVRFLVRNIKEGKVKRQFGVNGRLVTYDGRNDDRGQFRTYLAHGGTERAFDDLMSVSVRRFVGAVRGEGTVLATGAEGLRNLEIQVGLLERSVRV